MDAALSENSNTMAGDYELRRLCITFGVTQSNMLYRILSANDNADMMERIKQETENLKLSLRGGEKCEDGKVWDEVRQECV